MLTDDEVMARLLAGLLEAADATGEWDMPPVLLWVVRTDDDDPGALVPFDLPDQVWDAAPLPDVLERLPTALALAVKHGPPAPIWMSEARLVGVVFMGEGWSRMSMEGPPTPTPLGSYTEPPVREARVVTGVDGSAVWHGLHVRGEAPPEVERHPNGGGVVIDGRVVTALRGIRATILTIQAGAMS